MNWGKSERVRWKKKYHTLLACLLSPVHFDVLHIHSLSKTKREKAVVGSLLGTGRWDLSQIAFMNINTPSPRNARPLKIPPHCILTRHSFIIHRENRFTCLHAFFMKSLRRGFSFEHSASKIAVQQNKYEMTASL